MQKMFSLLGPKKGIHVFFLLCSANDVGVHSVAILRYVPLKVHVLGLKLDPYWFHLVCSVLRVV